MFAACQRRLKVDRPAGRGGGKAHVKRWRTGTTGEKGWGLLRVGDAVTGEYVETNENEDDGPEAAYQFQGGEKDAAEDEAGTDDKEDGFGVMVGYPSKRNRQRATA